jgi:hypothetical protein
MIFFGVEKMLTVCDIGIATAVERRMTIRMMQIWRMGMGSSMTLLAATPASRSRMLKQLQWCFGIMERMLLCVDGGRRLSAGSGGAMSRGEYGTVISMEGTYVSRSLFTLAT